MRSTLAIYITLSVVTVVAIAQILYFRLVLGRGHGASEAVPDAVDRANTWPGRR